jgi:hypothetical protein
VVVTQAEKQYVDITYILYNHQKRVEGESLIETIDFMVSRGVSLEAPPILHKTITIQTAYFMHLICLPPEKAKRNQKLLDLAAEAIKV